jgi:ribonuclease P protein component
MSPQVGFIVSKAVGNAVTRNLVKRRLRDIMRSLLKEPALSGAESQHTWIVIRANKHAATAAYNELFTDVWTAILKARRRDVARHATLAATGGMP